MSNDRLKVVEFPGGNVTDIPAGLRNVAQLIEDVRDIGASGGPIPGLHDVQRLVWISEDADGNTSVGAFGRDMDKLRTAGLAQKAINRLLEEGP